MYSQKFLLNFPLMVLYGYLVFIEMGLLVLLLLGMDTAKGCLPVAIIVGVVGVLTNGVGGVEHGAGHLKDVVLGEVQLKFLRTFRGHWRLICNWLRYFRLIFGALDLVAFRNHYGACFSGLLCELIMLEQLFIGGFVQMIHVQCIVLLMVDHIYDVSVHVGGVRARYHPLSHDPRILIVQVRGLCLDDYLFSAKVRIYHPIWLLYLLLQVSGFGPKTGGPQYEEVIKVATIAK